MHNAPIGLFDSGEGGLTVARALAELLPGESLLYACDGAHFPYGPRPLDEVRELFLRFLAFFRAEGCKLVVIACNTATAAALDAARAVDGPPVLGVIEPGAAAAAQTSRSGRIGVLATEATVRAGVYPRAIRALAPQVAVAQAAAPVLVTMAEAGDVTSDQAFAAADLAVAPLRDAGVDTLVLGCTHFPHMRAHLARAAGPGITLVDPGAAAALRVRELLGSSLGSLGERRFFTTGDPWRFTAVAQRLWPGGGVVAQALALPEAAGDAGEAAGAGAAAGE